MWVWIIKHPAVITRFVQVFLVVQGDGLKEELWTRLQEAGVQARLGRLCADDSFIPLAKAAYHVLPAKDGIVRAAQALIWGQDSPDADTIAGLRANSSKGGTLKPGAKIGSKGQAGEKS